MEQRPLIINSENARKPKLLTWGKTNPDVFHLASTPIIKQQELKPDLPEINTPKQNIFGSQGRPWSMSQNYL